jgi:Bleomycin resistance protein-like N-terminal
MSMVSVQYIVDDVEAAVAFYTTNLGFRLLTSALPAFADVARGDLRLLLSGPTSSGGRTLPDGRQTRTWRSCCDTVSASSERIARSPEARMRPLMRR